MRYTNSLNSSDATAAPHHRPEHPRRPSSVASCLSGSRIASASWWHFHPLHISRTVTGALHPSLRPEAYTAQQPLQHLRQQLLRHLRPPALLLPSAATCCARWCHPGQKTLAGENPKEIEREHAQLAIRQRGHHVNRQSGNICSHLPHTGEYLHCLPRLVPFHLPEINHRV
jgi:hypothetical protein